ncbi:unnamed protein product [Paramecium sonneborni]|uniref:Uncharacterized protein n=1 Tax=Paramecium sonneborni TaxID=65129 RepID=A0A8S1RDJ9_9CILI|nr:unnamed protein product [Paramecium sonneborni]
MKFNLLKIEKLKNQEKQEKQKFNKSIINYDVQYLKRNKGQVDKTIIKQDSEKYNLSILQRIQVIKQIMMNVIRRKKNERKDQKLGFKNEIHKPIFPSKYKGKQLTLINLNQKNSFVFKITINSLIIRIFYKSSYLFNQYKLKVLKKEYEQNKQNFVNYYTG